MFFDQKTKNIDHDFIKYSTNLDQIFVNIWIHCTTRKTTICVNIFIKLFSFFIKRSDFSSTFDHDLMKIVDLILI